MRLDQSGSWARPVLWTEISHKKWSESWGAVTVSSAVRGVGSAVSQATSGVSSAASAAVDWAYQNKSTISAVATVLAIIAVACGLGIITAETSCLIVGIAALGLGAVQLAFDARDGDWGMFSIDAFGLISGMAGLRAIAGTGRAVFWAFAGLCDARAAIQYQYPAKP